MLLTGKHSGHSYIRGNYEWKEDQWLETHVKDEKRFD